MLTLKYDAKGLVSNRECFRILLADNNLPGERKEWMDLLHKKDVIIDDEVKRIDSIEAFATGEGYQHSVIAIYTSALSSSGRAKHS